MKPTLRTALRIIIWIAVVAAATIWLAIAIQRETRHWECVNGYRPAHECNTDPPATPNQR